VATTPRSGSRALQCPISVLIFREVGQFNVRAQSVQVSEPVGAKVPGGQSGHEFAPKTGLDVLTGQSSHTSAPTISLNDPGGQRSHWIEPVCP